VGIANALHIPTDALLCNSLVIRDDYPDETTLRGLCRIIRSAAYQLDAHLEKAEDKDRWLDVPGSGGGNGRSD